jgi:YfiH family protein
MSTRAGGVSAGPYASMNLGVAVGDDPAAVAVNRARFAAACGAAPVFLRQVHGIRVVRIGEADAAPGAPDHAADASVTTEPGVACTVQVADCLPVLFAAPNGKGVGAAHAGWRGLAAGVLEATVAALCDATASRPGELDAWLGVCIGPRAFEVGGDVLDAFAAAPRTAARRRFSPAAGQVARRPGRPGARPPRRRGRPAARRRRRLRLRGRVTVLFVPARPGHRADGRRGLDRAPFRRRLTRPRRFARLAPHRRAEQVERDAERQRPVEEEGERRAEPGAAGEVPSASAISTTT